jgi:hypothetical protein
MDARLIQPKKFQKWYFRELWRLDAAPYNSVKLPLDPTKTRGSWAGLKLDFELNNSLDGSKNPRRGF